MMSEHLHLLTDDSQDYKRSVSVPAIRKKSDPGRLTGPFKFKTSVTRSPKLSKKSLSPAGSQSSLVGGSKHRTPSGGSGGVHTGSDEQADVMEEVISPSIVLTTEASPGSENGVRSPDLAVTDDIDGPLSEEQKNRRSNLEILHAKVDKIKAQINQEYASKESNVNAYLRQAPNVDELQRQKMKIAFEKQNQKSGQTINALQKKLESYQKKINEYEQTSTSHKGHHRLREMGQGIKGVVGNIKGARDTIVSKPKEFAHLIKNKFGSADNIHNTPKLEDAEEVEFTRSLRLSDDEASSITSGSGFNVTTESPPSVTQQATFAAANEALLEELERQKETKQKLIERLNRLHEEFELYKSETHRDMSTLKTVIEEERYRYGILEEQLNDLTELHQNEIHNLRQEIASASEKIEYQLDERIHDTQDVLENCSTRVTKLELHQQQQQIISLEGVDSVTFRTVVSKLINVVLALVAVVLVFVSTVHNMLSPFLLNRSRIITTLLMLTAIFFIVRYWSIIETYIRPFVSHYIGYFR